MPASRRIVLALLLAAAVPAQAVDAQRLSLIVTDVFDSWISPLYASLAQTASAQADAWVSFCSNPDATGLAAVRQAYVDTAAAWSSVEFIRFGPAAEDFRSDRISYWPDRKNATARALASLLAVTGTGDLGPARIRQMSAAAQGLPALERLLFDKGVSAASFASGSPATERRCALGSVIASNVADLAAEVRDGWKNFDAGDSREMAVRIATDLVALFQTIRDVKLAPVLGSSAETAKPRSAEGWRSGRMAGSIALNLRSAQRLSSLLAAAGDPNKPRPTLTLETAVRVAEELPPDAHLFAADPRQRSRLVLLYDAVTSARDMIAAELPAALGISLGFNSLDGD